MKIYRRDTEGSMRKQGDFTRSFDHEDHNQGWTLTKSIIEKKNLDVNKIMPKMDFEDCPSDTRSITFSRFDQANIKTGNDKEYSVTAEGFLNRLNSIEDKVSQLFFLETEAVYDSVLQKNVELMVEVRNLGGIVFNEGDFLRQTYLMDCYFEVSNLPLIMCNGFSHGLSVYLKNEGEEIINKQGWYDIGISLGRYFLNCGVLVQFCNDSFDEPSDWTVDFDWDKTEFCNGIQESNVIIGLKELVDVSNDYEEESKDHNHIYPESLKNNIYEISQQKILQHDVFSSVNFCYLSEVMQQDPNQWDLILLNFFKNKGEGICFKNEEELDFGIKSVVRLLRLGRISMLNFNRILKKILFVKAMVKQQTKTSLI